jgi:DNA-binding transcriptional LysR family regulator
LRIGPPEPVPPGWRADVLYHDELLLFVASDNPLAENPDRVTWTDVQARPVVGQFLEPYWHRYFVTLPDPPRMPTTTVDVSGIESVKRIVHAMDAVGLGVRTGLRESLESGQFVTLPMERHIELPYVLEYRSRVSPLPVVERFRRVLLEHIAHL